MKKAPAYAFARRMIPKQTPVRPLPKMREIALIDLADKAKKILRPRALFSGRNNAGKTLAAEFLARQLDVALFRIDLSKVVGKYIGETEKNLRRVFDAAEWSGAILLFDEADALFGKRSEVKDSTTAMPISKSITCCSAWRNSKGWPFCPVNIAARLI